jgi:hypothetical protein
MRKAILAVFAHQQESSYDRVITLSAQTFNVDNSGDVAAYQTDRQRITEEKDRLKFRCLAIDI